MWVDIYLLGLLTVNKNYINVLLSTYCSKLDVQKNLKVSNKYLHVNYRLKFGPKFN